MTREPGGAWDPETVSAGAAVRRVDEAPALALRPGAEAPARPVRGGFDGDLGHLAGLVLVNTIGTFLTAGLYRFWARTRLRRYFWHHVALDGTPADYTGHGSELFLGWAGAVLLLTGVAVLTALGILTESGPLSPFSPAQLALPALLFILFPAALWRARRYRLTRTAWRGIAFDQDGGTGVYVLKWTAWVILIFNPVTFLFTLIFFPFMRADLERYRVRHTLFGSRRFGFAAKGSRLLGSWLPVWLAGVATLAGAVALLLLTLSPAGAASVGGRTIGLLALGTLGLAALAFVLFVRYRVREFRYFVASTRLGETHFRSELPLGPVLAAATPFALGMLAYFWLVQVLLLDVVMAASGGGGPASWFDQDQLLLSLAILVGVVFLVALAMALLFNTFLRFFILSEAARTLTVFNLEAAGDIAPVRRRAPAFGEGLADALGAGQF